MLPIIVVNNHGQFNHLIRRALRDLDIEVIMVPNTKSPKEIREKCRGIILGGGPAFERSGNCDQYLDLGIPVLGICLGLHIIAMKFGGTVHQGRSGGYGPVEIEIVEQDDILRGYPENMKVWASHADEVSIIPEKFRILARSDICPVEAIALQDRQIYGLQWHPEVSHTPDGRRIFENFNRITLEYSA